MTYRKYAVGFAGIILICGIAIFLAYCNFRRQEDSWAEKYMKNLEYNFDDASVNMIMAREEWKTNMSDIYDSIYDFNLDGQPEQVQISFQGGETAETACISLNGEEVLQVAVLADDVQRAFTIVGIRYGSDTYLAAVESVYEEGGGMGKLKCVVYQYQDGGFIKVADVSYTGTIGNRGMMAEGVLESNCDERVFSYDVKEDQNNYIYQRSVVFADMKDLGIKFPFETVGKFETAYKRNVSGILNIIVE